MAPHSRTLERAADRFAGFVRSWAEEYATAGPERIAEALADSVMACLGEGRTNTVVEFELITHPTRPPTTRRTAEQLLAVDLAPRRHHLDGPAPQGTCDRTATTRTPGMEKAVLPFLRRRPPTCIKHSRDDRI
nr:hypothetical protein OG296_05850 [Streptomyces sp. NBC_01001]